MFKFINLIIGAFALFLITQGAVAQNSEKISKRTQVNFDEARVHYQKLELDAAIQILGKITSRNEFYGEAWILLGYCYLDQGKNDLAFSSFLKAFDLDPVNYNKIALQLAELSYLKGDYNAAMKFLDSYQSDEDYGILDRVKFALEQIEGYNNDLKVNQVLGGESTYSKYFPSLTIDGKKLVLTQQISEDINGKPGQEDLFIASFDGSVLSDIQPLQGSINTERNEGTQAIRQDGKLMFFTACNLPDSKGGCDIYYSLKEGSIWVPAKNIGFPVNSRYWESTPCISADGQTLFFASNRPGGFGGMDLWQSQFLSGIGWQEPINLGSKVNSAKDELAPFLHSDGKSLYFASSGHIGMGQLDLFISRRTETGEWHEVQNMGYPINTFNNEFGISIPGDGTYAVYSSDRDTLGLKSIYIVDLNDALKPEEISYVQGFVEDSISSKRLGTSIEIQTLDGKIVQSVNSDKLNGEFLIGLPTAASYVLISRAKGYFYFSKVFYLGDSLEIDEPVIVKMKPLLAGETKILRQIYFEFDSAILDPRSNGEILQIVRLLNENPHMNIEIIGHTDSIGSQDYNKDLSYRRAKSLQSDLVANRISKDRLLVKGLGSDEPIASNSTEEGRALNRRIQIRIIN